MGCPAASQQPVRQRGAAHSSFGLSGKQKQPSLGQKAADACSRKTVTPTARGGLGVRIKILLCFAHSCNVDASNKSLTFLQNTATEGSGCPERAPVGSLVPSTQCKLLLKTQGLKPARTLASDHELPAARSSPATHFSLTHRHCRVSLSGF